MRRGSAATGSRVRRTGGAGRSRRTGSAARSRGAGLVARSGRAGAAADGRAPRRWVVSSLLRAAVASMAVLALWGCAASGATGGGPDAGPAGNGTDAPAGDGDRPSAAKARAGAEPPAAGSSCVVARVVDGDTFVCRDGERVRLLLVNTPEMGREPYGRLARVALLGMIPPGTRVGLATDVERRDVYGRLLAHVRTPSGGWVNRELVRRGFAEVMVIPPNVGRIEEIRAAARLAREEGAGFWGEGLLKRSGPPPEAAGEAGGREGEDSPGDEGGGAASEEQGRGEAACHPSYPDVCLPPPPPDLDCADVDERAFRVVGEDPHRLDGNGDGVACERR